jgi:multidrug efflux pump subunit AcrA (membrane-fusion protein)
MKKIAGLTLCLLLLATGGCHETPKEKGTKRPAIQVKKTAVALMRVVHPPYEATGTVRSEKSIRVSPKVMGYIKKMNVREGDRVKKGQILLIISSPEIEAKVKMAEANLKVALQTREEVAAHLHEAEAGLDAAKAGYHLAEVTYNRFKNLIHSDSVSRQEFDVVESKYKAAKSGLTRAGEMVQVVRSKQAQVEARIKAAQSMVEEARSYLAYATVRSPINGKVVSKMIDTGNLVAPGTPILALADESVFRLYVSVEESLHSVIRAGDPVGIQFASGKVLQSKVDRVVPDVDPKTRTFIVKVLIPSQASGIQPGMFGRATFQLPGQKALLIPARALLTKGQVEMVFVVTPEQFCQMRLVKVGKHYGNDVEILSGLESGEKIILEDVQKAVDGAKVKEG